MFRDIRDIFGAAIRGKRTERGPSAVSASSVTSASETVDPRPEPTIDESLLAISRELSGLATMQAPQAAKERGWASLQRELERHPVRAAASATRAATAGAGATGAIGVGRPPRSSQHRLRLGLAAAAAAVVIVAVVLGTYSGGLLRTAGDDPTTGTSIVSSDTTPETTPETTPDTAPVTSDTSLPDTTVTSGTPTSTEPTQPDTTVDVTTPDTTGGNSGGTTVPTTSGGSGGSTNTSVTTRPPTQTTQPPRTTTTGETQNAASQREGSAKAAAAYLANVVLTGDTSGTGSLVAPEARSSLAQMVMSLNQPFGYKVPASGIKTLTTDSVRVAVEIDDRVLTGNGELVEMVKTFYIRVRVDDSGAVITAINAGPVREP